MLNCDILLTLYCFASADCPVRINLNETNIPVVTQVLTSVREITNNTYAALTALLGARVLSLRDNNSIICLASPITTDVVESDDPMADAIDQTLADAGFDIIRSPNNISEDSTG